MFLIALFLVVLALMISMIFNFKSMLEFKWNIDYMIAKEAVCKDYTWTKFELETFRYNFSKFLYNDDHFDKLVKDYKTTYSLVTSLTAVLLLLSIVYKAYYMYEWSKYNINKIISISTLAEPDVHKVISIPFLLLIIAIFVVHTVLTSKYLETLNSLNDQTASDTPIKTLQKYRACYKILSAIIVMSNLKNSKVELSHPAFTKLSPTFDQLLERNIASYENTNNTSKVKSIKLDAYAKLDFLKYFVFDQLSPYYLKYFDNVYVSIPSASSSQTDAAQHIYLDDLYTRYFQLTNSTATISSALSNALIAIKGISTENQNIGGQEIPGTQPFAEYIPNPNTNSPEEQFAAYIKVKDMYRTIDKDKFTSTNWNTITKNIKVLEAPLQYPEINHKIGGIIQKSGTTNIKVDNDDYIKYFLDNKEVLFDDTKLSDFHTILAEQSKVVYAYYFYFAVFFIMFSHYLYRTLEGSTYIYTLLGIIVMYILFVWLYTQISFAMVNN